MKKWLPLFLTGVMATWFLSTLRPPQDQDFAWSQFGRLPILYKGRVKPIDSLARNSLLQIREKQEANLEPWKAHTAHPKIISATEWLDTLVMDPAKADEWPVFRIDNPDVIALLRLPEKDAANHLDGKHYSWNQIEPSLSKLEGESQRIQGVEASHRTAYERAVMKTRERLWIYVGLKETLQPPDAENWESEVNEFEKAIPAGVAAVQAQQAGLAKNDASTNDASLTRFAAMVQRFDSMSRFDPPLLIPPVHDGAVHHDWMRTGEALLEGMRSGKVDAAVHSYAAMATAFKTGNVQKFNQEVSAYRASLLPNLSRALQKSRYEAFFNQMEPFYAAMVIYVLAGILGLFFWFNLSETLRRSAVWLVVLALVIHTTGLIFRMALEGRPPVTNLYSSAIFIGWGACVLGLVLERIHRNGIGVVVSSGIGFITLIIAHHLSLEGDTMEMMRAVLDTNFWLATHVVVVTAGYASTFVAGFLGLIYVILGLFTTRLSTSLSPQRASIAGATAGYAAGGVVGAMVTGAVAKRSAELGDTFGKTLARMIYGIVCFATLFSFVGTVLGGIWADQSWGRFWGWDPKENGALIIVLWNALILHLRWGGMVRERGLALCSIVGNIVTSWSWFGVNMLGIGLHAYGFMDAAFKWLMLFIASQLCFIALGSLPLHMWKSFQNRITSRPSPPVSDRKRPIAPATVA